MAKTKRRMPTQRSVRIPLKEIQASDIRIAIGIYDSLGREVFLEAFGFKPSHTFKIRVGDRDYDSKAIIGCAAGLESREFSGGSSRLAPVCKRCGYKLVNVKTGEEYS